MKKVLCVLIACIIALSLAACGDETVVAVDVENRDNLANNVFGESALIEIGDKLYYDSTTRIVYWWNGYFNADCSTSPSAYYAPNGLPYRYNPETNTLEEIELGRG